MKQTLLLIFVLIASLAYGQKKTEDKKRVIQFSGVVVTQDEFGEMIPLPYTTIGIKNTSRGTYSETDGFFSIVAEVGDTLVFSRIGFKTSEHEVSDSLDTQFYSWHQVMSQDNILLPCLLYTSPSPRDATLSRMPSSA